MTKPTILIITGYGLNCEAESAYAWETAGAKAVNVHLNDLLAQPAQLQHADGLMFIGGFSYGDHMTSGHVLAQRIRHILRDELERFIAAEKIILGVCNGYQTMVKLGLLPGLDGNYFDQKIALMQNDCAAFQNYWITLGFDPKSPCIFTKGLDQMDIPIRHGEGKLFTLDAVLVTRIQEIHGVPCCYIDPKNGNPTQEFPHNPNGSVDAIAGLCDPTGRIFGLMPHPEAFLFPQNHPQWMLRRRENRLPEHGDGLKIFTNAVNYLRG